MCVALRPDWEKAHFRRGVALEDKGEDNDALAAFEAAAATATGAGNPEIAKKIKHLKAKVRPSSIHVPKTKPVAPSKADPSDKGGPKGDPEWLVTAKSPGQPIHVRIGAVNRGGNWLAAHLERVLKRPAGESEWFFEEREVVAFLDAGVFGSMLDVLTHTVVSIIAGGTGRRSRRRRRRGGRAPTSPAPPPACCTISSTRPSARGTLASSTRRCSPPSRRCFEWKAAR